jgi:hypothetical protein
MGIFNISKKPDSLGKYLIGIQSKILEAPELHKDFIYGEGNKLELNEFKRFISNIMAGGLFLLKSKEYLGIEDFTNGNSIYKFIFNESFQNCLPFYNSYVVNNKIEIGLFKNDLFRDGRGCLLDFLSRFHLYQDEMKTTFKDGNPYFVEDHEPVYAEEIGRMITGEKIYFKYINLLFLTKTEDAWRWPVGTQGA